MKNREDAPYFAFQKKEREICILRCYSKESRVVIPEEIEGLPVTELAPYAFAGEMDEEPENPGELSCICGEYLEELVLPRTLKRLGRYVFYNCRNFRRMSFYSNITLIGAGAFTGCKRLSRLLVGDGGGEKSCLREVLMDLNHTVFVRCTEAFLPEAAPAHGTGDYSVLYPAFFEEAVENTPARIIETHTHGVGIQYRNAFKNTQIDWKEYDRLFRIGKHNMEKTESLFMAAYRLASPFPPSAENREEYAEFLRENLKAAAKIFQTEGERELLCWLAEQFVQKKEEFDLLLEAAGEDMETVSFLMDKSRHRFPKTKKKGFSI